MRNPAKRTTTKTVKRIETTTTTTFAIADVIKALGLPPHARLFFTVPDDGDYSGENLDLEDAPLTAVVVTRSDEESETPS